MNTLKTTLLLTSLTLFFLWIGNALGGKSGMTIAFIFALGMNFFSYFYSDKLVLKMYGAKPVNESDLPALFNVVKNLSKKANLPMPKVYIMEESQPNAFATGRNPSHAAVAVTRGIMNILDANELEGVLAHELSHIKNRDILISTIAATFAGAISYLAQMAQWAAIFGGSNNDEEDSSGSFVSSLIMMIVAPIAAMLIQMAISRSREFMADAGGAELSSPQYLASALRKLDQSAKQIQMHHGSPSTSHLFIVNPFSLGGITKLFSTHPPMNERIKKLNNFNQA